MKGFEQIFCVLKQTELEYHQSTSIRAERFERLGKLKTKHIHASHNNQKHFIESLKNQAEELSIGIIYLTEYEMEQCKPKENDLVISCGGDGTFLSCAQIYQDTTMLGMNSDFSSDTYQGSYGALTSVNSTNLKTALQMLLNNEFTVDRWSRLQVTINGKPINRYAVNDIYFGQSIAYQTCDLDILQSGILETFQCSGVLCCTGMGSHAWYYNAGGSPFSNEIDAFGFKVLFPNLKRPLKFTSGIISSRNELILNPERDHCILSFDSKPDVIEMELGDEIRVSLAPDKAVRVLTFKD